LHRGFSRLASRLVLAMLFAVAAAAGTVTGLLFAYAEDLPAISALDEYAPNTITRVYASGGEVVGEFAIQRRHVVAYDEIAPVLRQAIVAAEDADFDRHFGISISRIMIAAFRDIAYGQPGGASTLTQQLARDLYLREYMRVGGVFERSGFRGFERKIKEMLLAIQIEKRYTKREIFTLYANQVHVGHGAYGVESAARLYFGKSAGEVTLDDAAMIAGIIQTPARQNPYADVDRSRRRRSYTLQRMLAEGFITAAEAEEANKAPIVLTGEPTPAQSIAPYFIEEVRKHLEQRYGADRLYEAGLLVHTTLDMELQQAANRAVEDGLRRLDKRRGFRRPERNIVKEGQAIERFNHPRWNRAIAAGDVVPAVVTGVATESSKNGGIPDGGARLRIGDITADLPRQGLAWTRRTSAAQLLSVGDLAEVRVREIDPAARRAEVSLEQTPLAEAALIAIDNRTGQVRAMVGGFSWSRSKFNRAVQAYRQLGSAFKPIVYTAAIDRGYTAASILLDEPAAFDAGPGQPPYEPKNYDRKYEGPMTLRRVLEQSRNVPTVRVTEELTPHQIATYAQKLGFRSKMEPYLSLALGASEASLIELTSAYSAFPNRGVRMRPYQILRIMDRDGNLLEENSSESHDAIRADTAFIMTNLLRGVVQRGTAASAASLGWPLAGKTGTVDDYTDAWFIGFDPDITVGVWVGLDEKKPLGNGETGAQAALPIWIDFMRAHIARRPQGSDPPAFEPPGNIVFMQIDRATGVPVEEGGLLEAFISGTQPGRLFAR
jgi:penicillin-binding protein 1A